MLVEEGSVLFFFFSFSKSWLYQKVERMPLRWVPILNVLKKGINIEMQYVTPKKEDATNTLNR